ncbi:MAG: hypothetical protein Q9207_007901 [Kuettlingeria erythrocarpa]
MAETQPPSSTRKKLRESCNTCASSKVRCSKDQPSCERCSNRHLQCHYSPSRRTGKRRATSDDAASSTGQDSDPPSSAADSRPYQKQSRPKHDPPAPETADVPMPTSTLPDLKLDYFDSDAFLPWDSPAFLVESDNDPFSYPAPSSCTDSYMDSSGLDFGASFTPGGFGGNDTLLGGFYQDATTIAAVEALGSPPLAQHAPGCANHSADKPSDCMSLAINTLQSLHMAPPTCSIASGSPQTKALSLDPTIEHVLATNRAVLDSVSVILSCYCSLNAQVALVLTLIGSKLIAWYRAVLKNDDQPLHNQFGNGSSSNMMAERVLDFPSTVGMYNLEGADKGKIQAQLVLSELRRVMGLVDQLAKHFGNDGPGIRDALGVDVGKSGNKSVPLLCEQLQVFLQEGVQSVTKEAIGILRDS